MINNHLFGVPSQYPGLLYRDALAYAGNGVGDSVLYQQDSVNGTAGQDDVILLFHCLASQVSDNDIARGRVYPSLRRVREVSARIASAVASLAWEQGLATKERPDDLLAAIHDYMYQPVYPHYA